MEVELLGRKVNIQGVLHPFGYLLGAPGVIAEELSPKGVN